MYFGQMPKPEVMKGYINLSVAFTNRWLHIEEENTGEGWATGNGH